MAIDWLKMCFFPFVIVEELLDFIMYPLKSHLHPWNKSKTRDFQAVGDSLQDLFKKQKDHFGGKNTNSKFAFSRFLVFRFFSILSEK